MNVSTPKLDVSIAKSPGDIRQVQSLRYQVFVKEMGARGSSVDDVARIEADPYDAAAEHLVLKDLTRPPGHEVVGSYRMLYQPVAGGLGFSSDREFDHTPLKSSGKSLLELSRSCVHPDYRGGRGMYLLWQALSQVVIAREIDVLFGVASFWSADADSLAEPLSHLHHQYLAPLALRSASRVPAEFPLVKADQIDKRHALQIIPPLIKAYLRLGGKVGQGAYLDPDFGTVDVCMIVDLSTVTDRQRAIYAERRDG